MWEWLVAPVDASRSHEISAQAAWHARTMVLAWGFLAPLAIMVARFFKILPGQNWPLELDNPFWWHSHWIGQTLVFWLSIAGFVLVLPPDLDALSLHSALGYAVLAGVLLQMALGLCRGSKGGPTDPAKDGSLRGHHYDMTRWRRIFEAVHKAVGYGVLLLGGVTILLGLWAVNAPNWMWVSLLVWWLLLLTAFVALQRRGLAIDTYQAIWGDDPVHPGNRLPPPGWGVQRPGDRE